MKYSVVETVRGTVATRGLSLADAYSVRDKLAEHALNSGLKLIEARFGVRYNP